MATATSAWTKPGTWALESEQLSSIENPNNLSSAPSADFPSLASAAASSKSSKKKKPQTLSLAEFAGGKPVSHGAATRSRPSDASDETLFLPTGPRERSAEELERSSRGFTYSTYGNGGSRRTESSASRVSGENSLNRDSGFSRADEVDDWGSMKRSVGAPERKERGGGFFDSQSRADEVDSWVSKKGVGSSADGLREKRGGFEMFSKERSAAGGVDSDTWGRKRGEISRADSDTWGKKREEVNGGRPRLLLQPRTVPLMGENMEGNGEVHQGEKNTSVGNSKGLNPFGLARPREEVLAEKGQDWKELDEKLESTKIWERIPDDLSSGRKGRRLGSGNLAEDCTEKSWKKDVASDALASMKEDQTEAILLN